MPQVDDRHARDEGSRQDGQVPLDQLSTAFNVVKDTASKPETLVPFDETRQVFLLCDASDDGYGAWLCHLAPDTNRLQPIDIFSGAWTAAQRNYTVPEKEAAALRLCCERWRYELLGRTTIVLCDNNAVVQLLANGTTSKAARVRNTIADMIGFDFVMLHIPTHENLVADALSRDPRFGAAFADAARALSTTRATTEADELRVQSMAISLPVAPIAFQTTTTPSPVSSGTIATATIGSRTCTSAMDSAGPRRTPHCSTAGSTSPTRSPTRFRPRPATRHTSGNAAISYSLALRAHCATATTSSTRASSISGVWSVMSHDPVTERVVLRLTIPVPTSSAVDGPQIRTLDDTNTITVHSSDVRSFHDGSPLDSAHTVSPLHIGGAPPSGPPHRWSVPALLARYRSPGE
jgi:hypothetical protein